MRIESVDDPLFTEFSAALTGVARELAHAIVRDGEGATKFIEVRVEQAISEHEARQIAYAVAHSPLVKTAFFASDPNLGRILAAVGYAGIDDLQPEPCSNASRRCLRCTRWQPSSGVPGGRRSARDEES